MKNIKIEYRQRDGFDDWIYHAIVNESKDLIYIYRDRPDRVGEDGWNEWEVIANKSVDFDKWWRYEEVWDRKTNTILEIDDAYLEDHNIPHLVVDENGEVVN